MPILPWLTWLNCSATGMFCDNTDSLGSSEHGITVCMVSGKLHRRWLVHNSTISIIGASFFYDSQATTATQTGGDAVGISGRVSVPLLSFAGYASIVISGANTFALSVRALHCSDYCQQMFARACCILNKLVPSMLQLSGLTCAKFFKIPSLLLAISNNNGGTIVGSSTAKGPLC